MKKKVSRIDYSKAMLPRTRRMQLGDVLKINYVVLLKCGLMLFLFTGPLIAFSFFMDFFYLSLVEHTTEAVESTMLLFYYLLNAGEILLTMVALLGISGVFYVLRNLIWGEGIFFKEDFASGIKENGLRNLWIGLIFGAIYFLSYFIYSFFDFSILGFFPVALFIFVFFPIYFWMMLLNNMYNTKGAGLLRNSLFFYTKTAGASLLGILMPSSLVTLIFIPMEILWVKYLILVPILIFVFPIVLLIMVLYSTAKFDKFINQDNYPDYYLRGLNH